MNGTMLILMIAAAGAQRGEEFRLYRMMQAGTEVGRETYRVDQGSIERRAIVPLLNLRADSKTLFDSEGRFRRFEATVMNAAGDSVRGTYTIERQGDSLVATGVFGARVPVTRTLKARTVDGIVPTQSVSVIAEVVQRAAGRDTTFHFLPMGGDTTVAVSVRFSPDTAYVTTAGIPAYALRSAGSRATIEIPGQRVSANVWNGRDSLPPLSGLRRPTPDYSAPPGAPYTATEVTIPIRGEDGSDFALTGTLTLPGNAGQPVPVVITISGSGRQPRDEDLWPVLPDYRPFREIADRLARAGIGVLRYDDRGTGGSGGAETDPTSADYAKEVAQIVAWLRSRPAVDSSRIALLGHSEGGVIGPLVAAEDSRIAAVIILAGPSKRGRDIIRDQVRWPIEDAPGLQAAERARLLGDVNRQADDWSALNNWTRWFADYDPLPTARRLRQPVLILHGALDRQVSAAQADSLGAAIRAAGNRDVTVRVFPGLNHLFLPTDGDGSPADYPGLKVRALPVAVLDAIAEWATRRLK